MVAETTGPSSSLPPLIYRCWRTKHDNRARAENTVHKDDPLPTVTASSTRGRLLTVSSAFGDDQRRQPVQEVDRTSFCPEGRLNGTRRRRNHRTSADTGRPRRGQGCPSRLPCRPPPRWASEYFRSTTRVIRSSALPQEPHQRRPPGELEPAAASCTGGLRQTAFTSELVRTYR